MTPRQYNDAINRARQACTCQKRVVVCLLFDINGEPLSSGANQCFPDGGECQQLNVVNDKAAYIGRCHSLHAEANAAAALPEGSEPCTALVLGHTFCCPDCECVLLSVGVPPENVRIYPQWTGCGLVSEFGVSNGF